MNLKGDAMCRATLRPIGALAISLMLTGYAAAQEAPGELPSPVTLADVVRLAGERRDEIRAAQARVRAADARPAIASALPDPMLSPSLDHLPFMLNGADVSVTIEQQIPLSGIREHRRASAGRMVAGRLLSLEDRHIRV